MIEDEIIEAIRRQPCQGDPQGGCCVDAREFEGVQCGEITEAALAAA